MTFRGFWTALALALGAALLFALVSAFALESQEVAVLHTRGQDGQERSTRVWLARDAGALWLEAATPERPWYRDVLAQPAVELELAGTRRALRAEPQPGAAGHERIRALLREKYGLADLWVALLQDTQHSIAVRLVARAEPR